MAESENEFCVFIKKRRRRRKWRQEDMATKIEWSQAKVSKIETGATPPSLRDLEALARVFDVPLTRLVRIRQRAA